MAAILAQLKPTRRWLQFSLRTMALLTLAFGVGLGWFVDRAQRQKRAVEAIEAAGGTVGFQHLTPDPCAGLSDSPPPGPAWLCRLIGDEYFVQADDVTLPADRSPSSPATALLGDLPYLRVLRINGLQPSDQMHVRGISTLKRLEVQTSAGLDLSCFASNSELEAIELIASGQSAIDFRPLKAFPKLASLRLELNSVSNLRNALKQISRLRQLEELSLDSPNMTGDDLAALRTLEGLNYLDLSGGDFKDSALVHLKDLPRLELLYIGRAKFTKVGLNQLNKNLESIWFGNLSVSDVELACFRRLPKLRSLCLGECAFTDAGLASLVGMDRLEYFCAESCDATDAGVESVRRSMKNCRFSVR